MIQNAVKDGVFAHWYDRSMRQWALHDTRRMHPDYFNDKDTMLSELARVKKAQRSGDGNVR